MMDVLKRLEQSGIVPVVVLDDAKDQSPPPGRFWPAAWM